jgi:hypothetical protein
VNQPRTPDQSCRPGEAGLRLNDERPYLRDLRLTSRNSVNLESSGLLSAGT